MFITILIFIIILALLVFVHEFGHFIVAKKSGMKVDEFGFGFPPRIVGIYRIDGKWCWIWGNKAPAPSPRFAGYSSLTGGEAPQSCSDNRGASPPAKEGCPPKADGVVEDNTVYSINWIPLGGFVKIVGENNESAEDPRSFINKGFWPRFFTLIAGVLMNILLACVIFIVGYMVGLPAAVDSVNDIPAHAHFSQQQIGILDVQPGAPADKAGIQANDIILSIDGQSFSDISSVQQFIYGHEGQQVTFAVKRDRKVLDFNVTPLKNPGPDQGPTGIDLAVVGRLRYSPIFAIIEGVKTTGTELKIIVSGFGQLVTGKLGLSSLGGPVKIAQLTGQVAGMGFIYLMQFTAFLSLNLAVLNTVPFPALDGGRILFLIVEKVRRKRNNQTVEQWVNTIGFVLLLLLMVLVTAHDIFK